MLKDEAALEANEKFANSVSDIEVLKLELATKQAVLRVDLSRFNRDVQKVELGTADAKAALAAADVRLRRVEAPLAGEVAEIYARPGEWVESGVRSYASYASIDSVSTGLSKFETCCRETCSASP